jgi:putative tryptophan/tyrosine transport system substrate-binding protein
MDRRTFIASMVGAVLSAPLAAQAQQAGAQTPARIAFIGPGRAATHAVNISAFRDGMRENGLREGEHYVLDEKYAEGNYDRFPALTDEVLKRNPAIILVNTIASVRAAQQATKTVPIVFVSTNDPVGSGLVASLARPGGNTTGLSTQNEDAVSKYVELLRELLPRATHVAVLINSGNPSGTRMFERVRTSASGFGVTARAFEVTSPESFDAVFRSIAQYRPDALLIIADAVFFDQRDHISTFALKNRIPTIASASELVASGSLISYGTSRPDLYRRAAVYVKKILAGAKPGDLPVEQPTKFELVINLKTAKALKLTIPQSLLLRADQVIE